MMRASETLAVLLVPALVVGGHRCAPTSVSHVRLHRPARVHAGMSTESSTRAHARKGARGESTAKLRSELHRAYASTIPRSVSGSAHEPELRRSLRQAYEPDLRPAAHTPSAEKIESLLEVARAEAVCEECDSTGQVACTVCLGKGQLALGGYHKHNPLPAQIIGSRWTRVTMHDGASGEDDGGGNSRLLVTVLKLGFKAKRVYAQVAAVSSKGTGDGRTAWVPLAELRDRTRWHSGWLSGRELQQAASRRPCPAGCVDGVATCKACGGRGGGAVYPFPDGG